MCSFIKDETVGLFVRTPQVTPLQPKGRVSAFGFLIIRDCIPLLVVLEQPPWWNLTHTLAVVGVMAMVILAVAGWVVLLPRRVPRPRSLIPISS